MVEVKYSNDYLTREVAGIRFLERVLSYILSQGVKFPQHSIFLITTNTIHS